MNHLLILPILLPLLTAALLLVLARYERAQGYVSVAGAAALLVAALCLLHAVWYHGIQAAQMGNWAAPFGITLVADTLSAMMVVMAGLLSLAVSIYSLGDIDSRRVHYSYHSLLHFLIMGVCGAFLTGDVFNLYVWFEVMLISSFVLLCLGGERAQLEGSIKYVTLNLVSSAFFLAGVGILYGMAGTLNMAQLALVLRQNDHPAALVDAVSILFLLAFGIKAAVFPLFFWLPASYHTPPVAVSAIFAGLLTKVGVYALMRFFTLLFVHDVGYTHTLILVISGFTMLVGVLGAAAQSEVRRLLSFHIVSQIGYMVMGLALFTPLALTGGIFYIAHNMIVKTNLLLISGIQFRVMGSFQLSELGGLYRSHPFLSALFLISALSLAGVPPLSGFWGKLVLIMAGLEAASYPIVAVALVVSLLTLFSMTKIWLNAFWKPVPEGVTPPPPMARGAYLALLLPVVGLALLTLLIGLWVGPLYALSERAAAQLLDPTGYINTVLVLEP